MSSSSKQQFSTTLTYSDRKSKARYVVDKYGAIIRGRVLDVGADQAFLKTLLPADTDYHGIDITAHPGVTRVDLETERIPFPDGAFDAVLCLDVLEHLERIHAVFDDLCRVTSRWLIIALPNPWNTMMDYLVNEPHAPGGQIQHYGLPAERPADRHRWFYAASEARNFVQVRAAKNGMDVIQQDSERAPLSAQGPAGLMERLAMARVRLLTRLLARRGFHVADFDDKTLWWALKKRGA